MASGRFLTRASPGVVLWLALAAARAAAAADAAPGAAGPVPDPGLRPGQVVRIQLEALRGNGADDQGIATAFRFASPANRASTGPLDRFIRMIKAGPYRLMLEFEQARYSEVVVEGDRAWQRVTLLGRDRVRTYVFLLGRQAGPPCPGCWMTEAVTLVTGAERSV